VHRALNSTAVQHEGHADRCFADEPIETRLGTRWLGHARRLQYVTGHSRDGRLPENIDWKGLADAATTTAIYMPTRTLSELVTKAVAEGLDPATPAIAIARATRPDQQYVAAPIGELARKIATANLLYEALSLLEQGDFGEAVPRLERVLQQEPNTPIALLQLGRAYMALKQYQQAVAPLQSLVEKKPEDAYGRYELGCALVKIGQWDQALPHFEAAVTQLTGSSMMHFYLAMVYQRTSRLPEAMKEFQSALRIDPDNFAANLLLGRMFIMQQKATDALPYLRKASRLRADSIDAHRFLSDVYTQLGQATNAGRELAEAERLQSQGASRLGTPANDASSRQRP